MKFLKLISYVEKSYQEKPAFLILMDDGKEYISHGCQFVENTESNISTLTSAYLCKKYLNELLANRIKADEPCLMPTVTDALSMFESSKITSFNSDMPNVTSTRFMFAECSLVSFSGNMPMVTEARGMFADSTIETFDSDMSSVTDTQSMFADSAITSFDTDMPNVTSTVCMFFHSKLTSFNSDMPNVTDAYRMFNGTPYGEQL